MKRFAGGKTIFNVHRGGRHSCILKELLEAFFVLIVIIIAVSSFACDDSFFFRRIIRSKGKQRGHAKSYVLINVNLLNVGLKNLIVLQNLFDRKAVRPGNTCMLRC